MILGIAITLIIINILISITFHIIIKKQLSDKKRIENIKKETNRLIVDIAFRTDQAVTIIEDKLHEMNMLIAEVDKRILMADSENQKRSHTEQLLTAISDEPLKKIQKPAINTTNSPAQPKYNTDYQNIRPVQVYTKNDITKENHIPQAVFRDQIIEMSKKGLSIEIIAEKIPLPTGEIELIISMNS